MKIEEKVITIERTARYAQLGEINEKTTDIWLVVHGYAQLARDFIKGFIPLTNESTVVVAPEGLSRFYAKGFFGNIAASWMTSEDRENEIKDYVNYFNKLQLQLTENRTDIRINLLGFSQGVATVVRYVVFAKPRFSKLWLCAGELPKDVDWKAFSSFMAEKPVNFMYGTNDSFVTEEALNQTRIKLEEYSINYNLQQFDGGHKVDINTLKSV